jgi:hypothetical protein
MPTKTVTLVVAGAELKVAETPVKGHDHTYYALRLPNKPASPYGLPWKKLADELPTKVTIDGQTINLEAGKTPAVDQQGKPKVQRNRVAGRGSRLFPSIGEEKAYAVSISETTTGGWNIKVTLNRGSGSVSPEQRAATSRAKEQANADAMALFDES